VERPERKLNVSLTQKRKGAGTLLDILPSEVGLQSVSREPVLLHNGSLRSFALNISVQKLRVFVDVSDDSCLIMHKPDIEASGFCSAKQL
jgi:hypothetical protein